MSSQLLSRVGTPLVTSARKRNRSEPSVYGMIDLEESRKSKVARKRLYSGNSGEKSTESAELDASYVTVCDSQTESAGGIEDSEDSGTKCDNEVSTTIVEKLMANLEANINKQFNAINDRMDNLESRLEKKITQKVTQTLDKRVSSEMSKIKKSVDEHMNNVKADIAAEFRADFEDVSNKLDQISERTTGANNCVNLALNIVIRNLPEHNNENTMDKVNKLIKDGLKVADVECYQALRKGHNTNTHRVIVASFRSSEDKRKVMVDKKNLKNSDMYKTVYIHHDQSVTERVMSENFRTVLQALKQHGLVMRGQHVVQQDRREGQWAFVNVRVNVRVPGMIIRMTGSTLMVTATVQAIFSRMCQVCQEAPTGVLSRVSLCLEAPTVVVPMLSLVRVYMETPTLGAPVIISRVIVFRETPTAGAQMLRLVLVFLETPVGGAQISLMRGCLETPTVGVLSQKTMN